MRKIVFYSLIQLVSIVSYGQPCYPDKVVTAAYATHGSGKYKDKILWLTWGSTNQSTDPYGKNAVILGKGAKSYASVPLGAGSYLCVEAEIIEKDDAVIGSYLPGMYTGDSKDDLYRIEYPTGTPESQIPKITENKITYTVNNRLVSGIKNNADGAKPKFKIRCKATINGIPVRIAGMVLADAESLSTSEWIKVTAVGDWNVVEVIKNVSQSKYDVLKSHISSEDEGTAALNLNSSKAKSIKFELGNNKTTAAISFLSFNNDATDSAYAVGDYAVDILVEFKGQGTTAIALGLLTPYSDLADAPESYGSAINMLQALTVTSDRIDADTSVNINTNDYKGGELTSNNSRGYLGSYPADPDNTSIHSKLAIMDDITGDTSTMNEEDAWPDSKQRFSYKTGYVKEQNFKAEIPYHKGVVGDYIAGWLDFNLDGQFSDDEMAYAPVGADTGTVILSWTIPTTRQPYSTYARLRYIDKFNIPAGESDVKNITATSILYYGEVEDHRVYILGPTVVNPALPSRAKTAKRIN